MATAEVDKREIIVKRVAAEMRDGYLATESYRLAASNLPVPAGSGAAAPEQSIWDGLP